jgi:formylglycine-generating enzyme required for sulfatase activity
MPYLLVHAIVSAQYFDVGPRVTARIASRFALRFTLVSASVCAAAALSGCAAKGRRTAQADSNGSPTAPASSPVGVAPAPSASPSTAPEATVDASIRAEDAAAPAPANDAETPPEGMLPVPGGTFVMGADTGGQEDEHPAHPVTLRPFYLDRTEVTNAAYAECVRAKRCRPNNVHIASITHSGDDAGFARPQQPVNGVQWQDAHDYCAFREKRLPREAELERAIRGDDGRRFPWGDDPPTPARAVFGRALGHGTTDDVGTHPTGRGPYGHDDLAGNVWEWMEDEYDPYAYRRATASEGKPGTCAEILAAQNELRATGKQGFTGSNPIPTECERSIRGGAFNYDGPGLRSTNRVHHPARYQLVMLGLRCAKDR